MPNPFLTTILPEERDPAIGLTPELAQQARDQISPPEYIPTGIPEFDPPVPTYSKGQPDPLPVSENPFADTVLPEERYSVQVQNPFLGTVLPEELDNTDISDDQDPTLWDQFKAGFDDQLAASYQRGAALNDERMKVLENEEVLAGRQGQQAEMDRLRKLRDSALASMTAHAAAADEVPSSDVLNRLTATTTVGDFFDVLGEAPLSVMAEVTARNAALMIPMMASAIVGGAVGGPVGFAAGLGVSSGITDASMELVNELRSEGVDVTSEEAVLAALGNQELMTKVRKRANLHGLAVGLVDGLTGGVATITLAPKALAKQALKRELINIPAQTGVQMFGGGAGEALGTVLQGDTPTVGEVGVEAIGELAGGVSDVAGATLAGVRETGKAEKVQNILKEFEETAAKGAKAEETIFEVQTQELQGDFVEVPPEYYEAQQERLAAEQTFERLRKELPPQDLTENVFGRDVKWGGQGTGSLTTMDQQNRIQYVGGDLNPYERWSDEGLKLQENITKALRISPNPKTPGKQYGFSRAELALNTRAPLWDVIPAGFNRFDGVRGATAYETETKLINDVLELSGRKIGVVTQTEFDNVRAELIKAETKIAQVGTKLLKQWSKTFLPQDSTIIFSDGSFDKALRITFGTPMPGGFEYGTGVYGLMYLLGENQAHISVNTTSLAKAFAVESLQKSTVQETQAKLYTALAHEFGHTMFGLTIRNASPKVQAALYAEYHAFLKSLNDDTPYGEFVDKYFNPDSAIRIKKRMQRYNDDHPGTEIKTTEEMLNHIGFKADYILSFDEWAAEQTARALVKRVDTAATGGFFQKLAQNFKRFFQTISRQYKPAESIDAFIGQAITGRKINDLQGQLLENAKRMGETVQVTDRVVRTVTDTVRGMPPPPANSTQPPMPTPREIREGIDLYNKGVKWGFTLTQLVKKNQHIANLVQYAEQVRKWWNEKLTWVARADLRLKEWQQLSAGENARFSQFLAEMTLASDRMKRAHTMPEILRLAERFQFTDDMMTLLDGIQSDMGAVLDVLEEVLVADARRANPDNQQAQAAAVEKVLQEMEILRNRDFFPLSRFGKFQVMRKANQQVQFEGETFRIGEVVSFEMFETENEMKARYKELKRSAGDDFIVSGGKLPEDTYTFAGMPPQLVQKMEAILTNDPTQAAQEQAHNLQLFRNMMQELSPAQSFKRHLLNRKGTKGFSQDAMRGYADYFARFANHIARIKYYGALQEQIKGIADSAELIRQRGGLSTKRDMIRDHLDKHFYYIMNPKNEYESLRAAGFMWYLGFLPKSAVVNLTQIPLVAYPYLAAKYSDAGAVRELVKSFKVIKNIALGNHAQIEPELREALSRAVTDGFIDESLATELAAIAEGSTIQRYTVEGVGPWQMTQKASIRAQKELRRASQYGAYLFQSAEKMNRRATFVAAFRLAKQAGETNDAAYMAARDAIETTQYEYAKWNRADFMRGRRSVVFLFWQYLQNTLFFAFGGDKGALRFWMMMLFMGGLQGLPFAENVMDMWDFAARKMSKKLGFNHPTKGVREQMREYARPFLEALGASPDLLMHGTSRYAFGWPQIQALGIDGFGGFDLSGSLSMGDIIPGMSAALSTSKTGDKFMSGATDLGGAVISIPVAFYRALNDDHPDAFKRWERAMPSAMRNVSRAYRFAAEGEETGRSGGTLAEFDMNDGLQRVEVLGQLLGFTPERLAKRKEADWTAQQAVMYWEMRRRLIMQNHFWAVSHGDKAARQAAVAEWKQYNATVFDPRLRIHPREMRTSMDARMKGKELETRGLPRSKRYVKIVEEIRAGH